MVIITVGITIHGTQTGIIRGIATVLGGLIHLGMDQDGASAGAGAAGIQVCMVDTGILIIGAAIMALDITDTGILLIMAEVIGTGTMMEDTVLWVHVQQVMVDAVQWEV